MCIFAYVHMCARVCVCVCVCVCCVLLCFVVDHFSIHKLQLFLWLQWLKLDMLMKHSLGALANTLHHLHCVTYLHVYTYIITEVHIHNEINVHL